MDATLEEGEEQIGRRSALVRLLLAAGGALGLAALFPIRSLGPSPGDTLYRTPWRSGMRLVTETGDPVNANDLTIDSFVSVFPEGYVGSADGQAVLVRVDPSQLRLPSDLSPGAPQGFVAYSKVCTHAGCPVGLYLASTHQLRCPCHQSTFDVLNGAEPVYGPAPRPLPQLPLAIDPDGTIRATGDFSAPIGASFWGMS
jgi:ubiquinol-cytochrome c reductase iron-sulfur subunit